MMTSISGRLRGVQGGKLRAIAVSGRTRSPLLPDVPTIAESGYPGFEVITWFGLVAPSGTPQPVIQRLNHEVLQALKVPGVRDQYTRMGFEIRSEEHTTELQSLMRTSYAVFCLKK